MEKLVISQEYKFKKGGSEFHISEGQSLKVRLSSGDVIEGVLIEVGGVSQRFSVETANNEVVIIDCKNVVDIMPV